MAVPRAGVHRHGGRGRRPGASAVMAAPPRGRGELQDGGADGAAATGVSGGPSDPTYQRTQQVAGGVDQNWGADGGSPGRGVRLLLLLLSPSSSRSLPPSYPPSPSAPRVAARSSTESQQPLRHLHLGAGRAERPRRAPGACSFASPSRRGHGRMSVTGPNPIRAVPSSWRALRPHHARPRSCCRGSGHREAPPTAHDGHQSTRHGIRHHLAVLSQCRRRSSPAVISDQTKLSQAVN